jgi:hypothetical protein
MCTTCSHTQNISFVKIGFIGQTDFVVEYSATKGCTIAEVASRCFPQSEPGSAHVGFVVGKVALGQLFSEYFGLPCQSSFH